MVSSINYDERKVTNAIQHLAHLLPMMGNAYHDIADKLPSMSITQCHNLFQSLPLVNPVPTLPETAVNLFEEVGKKTFCTALAMGDHLVTRCKSQKAAAKYYGVSTSAVQRAISQDPSHSKGGRQYSKERKRRLSKESEVSSSKKSCDLALTPETEDQPQEKPTSLNLQSPP